MKLFYKTLFVAIIPVIAFSTPIFATTFTTVDLSTYVNSNVSINPQTFPTGTSKGNQATGIPFNVATYGLYEGTWNPLYSNTATLDVHLNVSGQAAFYALLNNYYGTPGANEYNITIKATNGDSVTYQSIGGVDTRDYNSNVFTNTVANTTFPWFDNGAGQRFDLREFDLPSNFASETISDFIITQVQSQDSALFSGLTFSDVAFTSTPEPMSIGLLGGGLALIGVSGLRRRKES